MPNLYVSTAGGTNKNDTTFGTKKVGGNTLKNLLQPNEVKTGTSTLKSGVLPQANVIIEDPITPLADYSPSTGSGSSSGSTANPYNGLADQLNSLYAQKQNNLDSYQQAMSKAALDAYSRNKAALDNAYASKRNNINSSFENTKMRLNDNYEHSKAGINTDAESALQQAYINKMLSLKNLPQQLAAQGLSGGASESTLAGLYNNYGNARNEIDRSRNDNLANLGQTYQNNLSDILNQYNSALSSADDARAQYLMQIENALANNQTNSYDNLFGAMSSLDNSYLSAMQNALSNQASYNAKIANANNSTGSTTTSGNMQDLSNPINYVKNNYTVGNEKNLAQQLYDNGYTEEQISEIFIQAGVGF